MWLHRRDGCNEVVQFREFYTRFFEADVSDGLELRLVTWRCMQQTLFS